MKTVFEYWTRSVSFERLQLCFSSLQTLLFKAITTLPSVTIGFFILDAVAYNYWGGIIMKVMSHMQQNPGQPLIVSPQQAIAVNLVGLLHTIAPLLISVHITSIVLGRGYTYWQIFWRWFLFALFNLLLVGLPVGLIISVLISLGVTTAAAVQSNMIIFAAIGALLYIFSYLGILFFIESDASIFAAWKSIKKSFVLVIKELPAVIVYSVVVFIILVLLGTNGQSVTPLVEGNVFVYYLQKLGVSLISLLNLSVASIYYLLAKHEDGLFADSVSVDDNTSNE